MVIPADVSTWTREHYPRDAKCYCGHTAYWHMWWPVKDKIGVCEDATYVPPGLNQDPCGCTGFAWPQPTKADVITPDSPWMCTYCGIGGHGPDALYTHLRGEQHKGLVVAGDECIVFPEQEAKS